MLQKRGTVCTVFPHSFCGLRQSISRSFTLRLEISQTTLYDLAGFSMPRTPKGASFHNLALRLRRFIPMTSIQSHPTHTILPIKISLANPSSYPERILLTLTIPLPLQKPGLILNSPLEFNPPIPKAPQRHNFLPPRTHRTSKTSQKVESVPNNPLSEDFGWYCCCCCCW